MQPTGFVPWMDDALVPGESIYAIINKLAWFSAKNPWTLMSELRSSPNGETRYTPRVIGYSGPDLAKFIDGPAIPLVHGKRIDQFSLSADWRQALREDYTGSELRYCPACLYYGSHFEATQSQMVAFCPIHRLRIISHCGACGDSVFNGCLPGQRAFACSDCGKSFLDPSLSDLTQEHELRKRASAAHMKLKEQLSQLPPIAVFSAKNKVASQARSIGAARILGLHPTAEENTGQRPYFAARVRRSPNGLPRLERLENMPDRPSPISRKEWQDSIAQDEIQLAQMRAGNWALRNYHDHTACITVACMAIEDNDIRRRDYTSSSTCLSCPVGRGFAAWNFSKKTRLQTERYDLLWEAWDLKDDTTRAYSLYLMEKACLNSSIMNFADRDTARLYRWESSDFTLNLENTSYQAASNEQTVIFVDPTLMTSQFCHLEDWCMDDRLKWVASVLQDILPGLRSQQRPEELINSTLLMYGSKERFQASSHLIDGAINARRYSAFEMREAP